MIDFFASLYEWFGLIPFYSNDMGDFLRGWDITCTDYIGTPWYQTIGWIMILTTSFFYVMQYHIIDSTKWKNKFSWWITAFLLTLTNYLIAFLITYNQLNLQNYCSDLFLTMMDCIGFATSNALWSLLIFVLITTVPIFRRFSTNCRYTTFWKP